MPSNPTFEQKMASSKARSVMRRVLEKSGIQFCAQCRNPRLKGIHTCPRSQLYVNPLEEANRQARKALTMLFEARDAD